LNASLVLLKRAGWEPPGVPEELCPIPPLPSLRLVGEARWGDDSGSSALKGGVVHLRFSDQVGGVKQLTYFLLLLELYSP